MTSKNHCVDATSRFAMGLSLFAILLSALIVTGQERPEATSVDVATTAAQEAAFKEQIQPLLKTFCVRCHNADNMESGIRVDQLTAIIEDRHIPLWKGIQKQIESAAMPPEDEPQFSVEQRKSFDAWITKGITAARSRHRAKNGAVRRLTVAQYRNTLRDLLGIEEDLTDALPPDGTSKDGFTNNAQVLALSPLQVETYFDIAEKALDQCIVDDPPSNVPQLKEDADAKLTLREKLERHRNQKGCAKCHSGIDPWGLPFESFDAGGLPKKSAGTDTRSKLPDNTEIADLNALKKYLAQDRIDQVAFSVLKHLATYANGRSLTYNEQTDLQEQAVQLRATDYRMKDLIRFVIKSDPFLMK